MGVLSPSFAICFSDAPALGRGLRVGDVGCELLKLSPHPYCLVAILCMGANG